MPLTILWNKTMCQQHTFCKKNWCFNVSPKLGFKHLTILTVNIPPASDNHHPTSRRSAHNHRPGDIWEHNRSSWALSSEARRTCPGAFMDADGSGKGWWRFHVAGECWHSKLVTRNQWSKHLIIQMSKLMIGHFFHIHKTKNHPIHPLILHRAYNWYPLHIGYSPFSKSLLPQALLKCWVLNNQEDQRSPPVVLPFCPAHPRRKGRQTLKIEIPWCCELDHLMGNSIRYKLYVCIYLKKCIMLRVNWYRSVNL